MRQCSSTLFVVILCLTPAAVGCGWLGNDEEGISVDLPELSTTTVAPAAQPDAFSERLELKLQVGDRFPLIKTVEQTLEQPTRDGTRTSHSKLQLLLAISVDEIREGNMRLSVRYHRVRYAHDIGGQWLEYDSSAIDETIPMAARAYAGLVNNTFSFWIGPDNQLLELVGFEDFLSRCLRDIPEHHRTSVMAKLIETSGDEGIANFVDDSIGLLPYNVDSDDSGAIVQVGDTWFRERQMLRPTPMYVSSRCTLRSLTNEIAQIDIVGSVQPSATSGPSAQEAADVQITVRGGDVHGSCTIDRQTGLPLKSHIEQHVQLVITLGDGAEYGQRKQIVTTIQALTGQQATNSTPESSGLTGAQLNNN